MAEVLDVINAFGTPLKVAWVVWLAWGVGQYFWYRHERSVASAPKPAALAKPVVRKPASAARPVAPAAEAPIIGRLITPQHVASQRKVAPEPPPAPVPAAPQFDPSMAVIETFSASPDDALDKFVNAFDMQEASPRRGRTRPGDSTSFGAEAPQAS
jgi:hypothetical protein